MKTIKLKEGQKLIDKDGNEYLSEKGDIIQASIKEKTIKEAGQYTFDGEVVDSFYDENKVYKAIEKRLSPILVPLAKGGFLKSGNNLRKVSEEIYDYITEVYGGVPENMDIDSFLDNLWAEDDFRDEIWVEKVLDTIKSAFEDEAKWANEYYLTDDGDFWPDNAYIALENVIIKDLPPVLSDMGDRLDMDDAQFANYLAEYVDDEITSDDLECVITHMNEYSDKNALVIYSTPIGEMEHQVADDLLSAFEELDEDDKEYVSNIDDAYVNDRGWLYVDGSYEVVNYYVDFKNREDDFEEWLGKKDYIILDIGASVFSGNEEDAKIIAEEEGIEIDWDVLNVELQEYEMFVLNTMKKDKRYNSVFDEGHDKNDDFSLMISIGDADLAKAYREFMEDESTIDFMDSSKNSPDSNLVKEVQKFLNKTKYLYLLGYFGMTLYR